MTETEATLRKSFLFPLAFYPDTDARDPEDALLVMRYDPGDNEQFVFGCLADLGREEGFSCVERPEEWVLGRGWGWHDPGMAGNALDECLMASTTEPEDVDEGHRVELWTLTLLKGN